MDLVGTGVMVAVLDRSGEGTPVILLTEVTIRS